MKMQKREGEGREQKDMITEEVEHGKENSWLKNGMEGMVWK